VAEKKNNEAFVKLYNATYDNLLKYVVSKCGSADDIPDIMQKIYLNYYERVKKHGNADDPESYLFKIAQNEMKKHYKLKAKHKNDVPVFSKAEDDEFEAMEALLAQELPESADFDMKKIWRQIKTEDDLTFKIFVLYFYHGEKLANIAKILDVGESTVKNRLYRTIGKMRDMFLFT